MAAWIGGFREIVFGCHGPWFSLEVTRDWAPWAFSKSPNKVIASLELLATLIGVKLWVPDSRDRQVSKLAIRGYTDKARTKATRRLKALAALRKQHALKTPKDCTCAREVDVFEQAEVIFNLPFSK